MSHDYPLASPTTKPPLNPNLSLNKSLSPKQASVLNPGGPATSLLERSSSITNSLSPSNSYGYLNGQLGGSIEVLTTGHGSFTKVHLPSSPCSLEGGVSRSDSASLLDSPSAYRCSRELQYGSSVSASYGQTLTSQYAALTGHAGSMGGALPLVNWQGSETSDHVTVGSLGMSWPLERFPSLTRPASTAPHHLPAVPETTEAKRSGSTDSVLTSHSGNALCTVEASTSSICSSISAIDWGSNAVGAGSSHHAASSTDDRGAPSVSDAGHCDSSGSCWAHNFEFSKHHQHHGDVKSDGNQQFVFHRLSGVDEQRLSGALVDTLNNNLRQQTAAAPMRHVNEKYDMPLCRPAKCDVSAGGRAEECGCLAETSGGCSIDALSALRGASPGGSQASLGDLRSWGSASSAGAAAAASR